MTKCKDRRNRYSQINYRIHTNVAMFGQTARQWREAHPELKGNIRDYASINELICLANMENINAVLIDEDVPQGDRLVRLNQIAINQMRAFISHLGLR